MEGSYIRICTRKKSNSDMAHHDKTTWAILPCFHLLKSILIPLVMVCMMWKDAEGSLGARIVQLLQGFGREFNAQTPDAIAAF